MKVFLAQESGRISICVSLIAVLIVSGCAPAVVTDWKTVPENAAIEVHTKQGSVYRFDNWEYRNWKIAKDSSIVGSVPKDEETWISISIPADSIAVVYVGSTPESSGISAPATFAGAVMTGAGVLVVLYLFFNWAGMAPPGMR